MSRNLLGSATNRAFRALGYAPPQLLPAITEGSTPSGTTGDTTDQAVQPTTLTAPSSSLMDQPSQSAATPPSSEPSAGAPTPPPAPAGPVQHITEDQITDLLTESSVANSDELLTRLLPYLTRLARLISQQGITPPLRGDAPLQRRLNQARGFDATVDSVQPIPDAIVNLPHDVGVFQVQLTNVRATLATTECRLVPEVHRAEQAEFQLKAAYARIEELERQLKTSKERSVKADIELRKLQASIDKHTEDLNHMKLSLNSRDDTIRILRKRLEESHASFMASVAGNTEYNRQLVAILTRQMAKAGSPADNDKVIDNLRVRNEHLRRTNATLRAHVSLAGIDSEVLKNAIRGITSGELKLEALGVDAPTLAALKRIQDEATKAADESEEPFALAIAFAKAAHQFRSRRKGKRARRSSSQGSSSDGADSDDGSSTTIDRTNASMAALGLGDSDEEKSDDNSSSRARARRRLLMPVAIKKGSTVSQKKKRNTFSSAPPSPSAKHTPKSHRSGFYIQTRYRSSAGSHRGSPPAQPSVSSPPPPELSAASSPLPQSSVQASQPPTEQPSSTVPVVTTSQTSSNKPDPTVPAGGNLGSAEAPLDLTSDVKASVGGQTPPSTPPQASQAHTEHSVPADSRPVEREAEEESDDECGTHDSGIDYVFDPPGVDDPSHGVVSGKIDVEMDDSHAATGSEVSAGGGDQYSVEPPIPSDDDRFSRHHPGVSSPHSGPFSHPVSTVPSGGSAQSPPASGAVHGSGESSAVVSSGPLATPGSSPPVAEHSLGPGSPPGGGSPDDEPDADMNGPNDDDHGKDDAPLYPMERTPRTAGPRRVIVATLTNVYGPGTDAALPVPRPHQLLPSTRTTPYWSQLIQIYLCSFRLMSVESFLARIRVDPSLPSGSITPNWQDRFEVVNEVTMEDIDDSVPAQPASLADPDAEEKAAEPSSDAGTVVLGADLSTMSEDAPSTGYA
ncbi:hypothetical protein PHYBOEH_011226 [Phytophthora boehmeriae]|uniref:Uncharacterized protein n=1 Tax=Phytophthora boehmeriae TaxID=109152 RepID=A0A8T1VIV0_9STRA|nr:hypothetical protein PHYBOEH_011226 [Phytophthora boehmeriae]